jgi:hypothetical protein
VLYIIPQGLEVSVRTVKEKSWRHQATTAWLLFPGEYKDSQIFSSGGSAIFGMPTSTGIWLLMTRHERLAKRLPDGLWNIASRKAETKVNSKQGFCSLEDGTRVTLTDLKLPARATLIKGDLRKQMNLWNDSDGAGSRDYMY